MISAADFFALALQCAPTVHPATTTDIGYAESRFQHLAIGVVRGDSIYPKDINSALEHIRQLKEKDRNYSIGLMQINQSNFEKYGVTAKDMFDPCKNLSVFEKILTDCYTRGETLKRALSCYYSGNFETGLRPEKAFSDTSYVQRVGYVVPSTRPGHAAPANPLKGENVRYPDTVVRGTIPLQSQPDPITYPAKILRGNFITSEAKESKNEIIENPMSEKEN